MTKLDDIEAKTIPGVDAEGRRVVAMSRGAYDLLIRAVRELEAVIAGDAPDDLLIILEEEGVSRDVRDLFAPQEGRE